MKASIKKASVFTKAALAAAAAGAVALVPAAAAQAASVNVPCTGPGGGTGGLIAAINTVSAAGGGSVNLASSCVYNLSAADNLNPSGNNGLPIITKTISINGSNTVINANQPMTNKFRILEVDAPGSLSLNGLTLTGGWAPVGGALLNNEGTLSLTNVVVKNNTANMGGGGIASGVLNPQHTKPAGTLTINNSKVNANTAMSNMGGGGGGILNRAGTMTINSSQVNNNVSGGGGGGIANGTGGLSGGGALNLSNSCVCGNTSNGGPDAGAGGIANGGTAQITNTSVNTNKAPGAAGGGILNHGSMTITNGQVNWNKAVTDMSSHVGFGGGIANVDTNGLTGGTSPSGVLQLKGTQVEGNQASGFGGGIVEAGLDSMGNPSAPGSALMLSSATVTGNAAGIDGGAIWATAGSPVTATSSTINSNTPDNCVPLGSVPGCVG
ncbi:MAG TPA: hypothetical protein VFH45_06305 [Acidimicrobiales bacterium]|nr:hypothetical protein [Acidimicrobiales bacterium]